MRGYSPWLASLVNLRPWGLGPQADSGFIINEIRQSVGAKEAFTMGTMKTYTCVLPHLETLVRRRDTFYSELANADCLSQRLVPLPWLTAILIPLETRQ